MILRSLICILVLTTCASTTFAQATYSDSIAYVPRPPEKPAKQPKRKTRDSNSDAANLTANSTTEIVLTVPVAFLDRSGSAIHDVQKSEVSVFVDGAEVSITGFEKHNEPLNVIFLLDISPSADDRLTIMREQALKLVDALPLNTRVMIANFDANLKVRSELTDSRAETKSAIAKVKRGSGTALYNAVKTLYKKILPTIPGRKLIILMTDGVDTLSGKNGFAESLTEVEKEDVIVYPIYFDTYNDVADSMKAIARNRWDLPLPAGSSAGTTAEEYRIGIQYLSDMAAASGGRIFSSEKLEDGTKSLIGELANRYYITVAVPRKNVGSRPIRVRINRPSVAVFARGSFVEK